MADAIFSGWVLSSEVTEFRNYSFRYNRSVLDKEKPYNELPLVRSLAAAALTKCRDKVKHKRSNDLLGVFSYQD